MLQKNNKKSECLIFKASAKETRYHSFSIPTACRAVALSQRCSSSISFPNLPGELKVTLVFHCSGFPVKDLLALDGKGLPASRAMRQVTQAVAAFAPAGEGFFFFHWCPAVPKRNSAHLTPNLTELGTQTDFCPLML